MLKIIRRVFSFADWSQSHPAAPHPGDMLDAQFDEIIDRIDGWDEKVRRAITEDGKIAYGAIDNKSVIPQIAEAVYTEASEKIRRQVDAVDRAEKAAKISKDAAEAALIRAQSLQAQASLLSDELMPAQQSALASLQQVVDSAANLLREAKAVQSDILNADNRADEANNNALLWAEVSQDWAEHMPDTIPPNTLAWMGISGEHWSARWWANRADNAFGRLTDLYLGAHPEPPFTNLEGGPIQIGSIYFDTDPPPGQAMIWNGTSWQPMWSPGRSIMATLTYDTTAGQLTQILTQPDINGDSYAINPAQPEAIDVHLNGVRLVQTGSAAIGDYALDPATSTVTFARPLYAEGVLAIDILMPEARMAAGQVEAWAIKPLVGFNGSLKTFTLVPVNPAVAVNVGKSEELLFWLNDAIQQPGVDYAATGDQITFAQAPMAGVSSFGTWFEGQGATAGGGSVAWVDITGKPASFPPSTHSHPTSQVTGLDAALLAKAPLASPAFTGDPKAPTPLVDDNDTSIATTAFVQAAIAAALAGAGGGGGGTPVGEVIFWPKTTPPANYLKANGATISRTTYADLFAAIGTTFGAGDGTTTFRIPDLRGEFIRGLDDGRGVDASRVLGSAQAEDFKGHTHVFTGTALAAHNHTATGNVGTASAGTPAGSISSDAHTHTGTTASGGSHSHTYTRTIESQGDTGGEGGTGMLTSTVNTSTAAAHTHTFTTSSDTHNHTFTGSAMAAHDHTISVTNTAITAGTPAGANSTVGGTETRPRNVALLACIKYQMG